jgi:penicillin amidase
MPFVSRKDVEAAVPQLDGTVQVPGLSEPAEVWRDAHGIPHVRAGSVRDAVLAQGFVHAQDRLWQMDVDRRRAYGRWAEYVGPTGVAQDVQMRRLRLEASARVDYEAVNAETRALLDAYTAGVNAFLATAERLPVEYDVLGVRPEPWRPWDCGAVYKIRHVLMGVWQMKAWRGRLVRHLGARRAAALCPGTQPQPMLIIPPGAEFRGPSAGGLETLAAVESALAPVADWEGGSNNWAVAGTRTASGKPLVAGDPHRALDVPNVYYQNHVACPELDAIGLSFPGVPGFPHFGHNAHVAWCVTHTGADYQDLFIERFDGHGRYEFQGDWREAERSRETIEVRGGARVEIEVTETHHGPVVLGDPASGHAIAMRYTATAEPNPTFEALLPMLRARTAAELEDAMRPWVDPVNNLVFADVHGTIGYRTRGRLPIRSLENAWGPVPGWDGAHEWRGMVPFEAMPAVRDPGPGWVATANSRVTGAQYPHYIALDFAPDFRTRRLAARLDRLVGATVADMGAIHADRLSLPALQIVEALRRLPRPAGDAGDAHDRLCAWDGVMDRDAPEPLIYSALRDYLVRAVLGPILGPLAADAFSGTPRGPVAHAARIRARLGEMIAADDRTLLPSGRSWSELLQAALESAVEGLRGALGPEIAAWRWGRVHRTNPVHPLSVAFEDLAPLLDPPAVAVGGDGDTVQAASYIPGAGFTLSSTSVARYVFDLGDWERSAWVVPLGGSGHPGSPYYADQARAWSEVQLLPMQYDWAGIRRDCPMRQVLEPPA